MLGPIDKTANADCRIKLMMHSETQPGNAEEAPERQNYW